jgi:hypothetical protein
MSGLFSNLPPMIQLPPTQSRSGLSARNGEKRRHEPAKHARSPVEYDSVPELYAFRNHWPPVDCFRRWVIEDWTAFVHDVAQSGLEKLMSLAYWKVK